MYLVIAYIGNCYLRYKARSLSHFENRNIETFLSVNSNVAHAAIKVYRYCVGISSIFVKKIYFLSPVLSKLK